jgi:hypothetical protein
LPEISRFFGIVIRMFAGLDPVDLRMVEAWAELHQAELASDWQNLQTGHKPAVIEPLK